MRNHNYAHKIDIDPSGEFAYEDFNRSFFRMLTRVSEEAKVLFPTRYGSVFSQLIFAFRYSHDSMHLLVRGKRKGNTQWPSVADGMSIAREQVERSILVAFLLSDQNR